MAAREPSTEYHAGKNVKVTRSRGFVFTFNNYTPEDESRIQTVIKEECSYGVYGREIAPSTSTEHLQGCVEFLHPRTLKGAIAALQGAHVEKRRGTPLEASTYCKKTRDVFEYGTMPKGSGARSDLDLVRHSVKEGVRVQDYAQDVGPQALRYAENLLKYNERQRDFKPLVMWFYGATGSGKSRTAYELSEDPWVNARDLEWWDGYDAHEHIIIDDFRASHCTFTTLLRILDRYPFRVPFKGGHRQLLAKQIIITSAYPPTNLYSRKTIEDVSQLLRRIDFVIRFDPVEGMVTEKAPDQEPLPPSPPSAD